MGAGFCIHVLIPYSRMTETVTVSCGQCNNHFLHRFSGDQMDFQVGEQSQASSSASNEPTPREPFTPEEEYTRQSALNYFLREEMQRMKAENPNMKYEEAYAMALNNWARFGYNGCVSSLKATSVIHRDSLTSIPFHRDLRKSCTKGDHSEAASSSASKKPKPKALKEELHQRSPFYFYEREAILQLSKIPGITLEEAYDIASTSWAEFGYQWCFDSLVSSLRRRDRHISIPKLKEIKVKAPKECYPKKSAFDYFVWAEGERMANEIPGNNKQEAYDMALKKWYKFGFQWCVDCLIATSAIDKEALMKSPIYELHRYFDY